ncbi:type IV secretion system DNA-binding domain-containing protein [Patescibacteria group bacterium]|nr:type IV secretion system DNA-binding domain-containing protein [Patescibacteria group bacterium]MBU2579424.1 type IV secretion system DNA-binding domain-containing protein [Patescibacteria group bacterium]MBU4030566.1 type IV secretion system DNA-binding domain-containing protein [Patescibacteria group bacterium]
MSNINIFAKTNFRGGEKVFGIKTPDRRQHTYVIGKTGVGKTVLLKNMALQDIKNGHGVCIVDPHGEFVEEVIDKIPSHRINDVIYFNPEDMDYPVGFNVLQVSDPKYKHLVSSDLMGIFTKIWANVWSARMEYILSNCILALLDTPGTTLLGIMKILVDKDYRQKIIDNVKDPVVRSFWINEYASWKEQFRNEAISAIQNKVGQFLSTSLIRNIVGQSKSTINIAEIMNSNKILLVNVAKGRIGEDNSALLGAMIITKIQLAAMERVRIPEEERKDFYLYVDEFQNFATDSFANILSEARKYRLNLTIAHQYIGQLVGDATTTVRDAVFGNVGTLISFRVGAADAEFLEKEFTPEFLIQDLVNLENYNIYLKLMIDGVSSRPFSATTLPPMEMDGVKGQRDKIIGVSRERYANSREEVEEKIIKWSGMAAEESKEPSLAKHKTACWSCGQETEVGFEPDGKRPIYCKTCFEKVRAGENVSLGFKPKTAQVAERPKEQPARQQGQQTELKELGIEFETVSLEDALKKEATPFRKKRVKVDLKDLRKTLDEAIGKK